MKQPSGFVLNAGKPAVAWLICMVCAVVIISWVGGSAPWWFGIGAFMLILNTMSAVRARRAWLQWKGEWDAMGQPARLNPQAPAATPTAKAEKAKPAPNKFLRRLFLWAAWFLFFVIPLGMNGIPRYQTGTRNLWTIIWLSCVVYLVRRFLQARKARKTKREGLDDKSGVVTWLVPPAHESATRRNAMGNLPEYTEVLFGQLQGALPEGGVYSLPRA